MTAPVSRSARVAGLTTHYVTIDGGRGVPVVLVHGLAVSHRYLMPTARALAPDHPVRVPDLPGFGYSGKPATVYGPRAHAAHLADLLRDPATRPDGAGPDGAGPYCVVGHSFGAEVAAALAVDHPDVVGSLVLAGPTSDPAARSYPGQVGRWLLDLLVEDPRQAAILARDIRDAGPRRVAGSLRHSVHNAIEDDLRRVTVPVLLLRGSLDPVAPHRWLSAAARYCAGPAVVATVPGAGHNALTTHGPAVAARIRRFLAWCTTVAGG